MARKLHVIGNWKMFGSKPHVDAFVTAINSKQEEDPSVFSRIQAVICPPYPYLDQAAKQLGSPAAFKLGAQDMSAHKSGPYTGQVAGDMLIEHNCQFVIIGHSERRAYCAESEEEIANKFFAAKTAGLMPILCVGETEKQRREALTSTIVVSQLQSILSQHGINSFENAIIAYEPIWAIGTGLSATPAQAQEVHDLLRRTLAEYDAAIADKLLILYGGSVKPNNAQELFSMADIDGALVGGASQEASDFLAICKIAANLTAK